MKIVFLSAIIFLSVCAPSAQAQDDVLSYAIVPHLTVGDVKALEFYYSAMLNLKIDASQAKQFQNQVVAVWENQDYEKMGVFLVEIETGKMLKGQPEVEQRKGILREYVKFNKQLEANKTHAFNAFVLAASAKERAKPAAEICRVPQRIAAPTANFYRSLKIGHYEGANTLTTSGLVGKAALDVTNIDAAGKITANFAAFSGLDGDGDLQGAIDEKGTLFLWGKTDPKEVMCVEGVIAPDGSITAQTRFESGVVVRGEFKIAYKSVMFANRKILQNPIPQMLYGRFEFNDGWASRDGSGGYYATTTSAGNNRTIEFFDDGSYRYIQAHSFCPSGICRTEGTVEAGTFVITGDTITFTFKGGADTYADASVNRSLSRIMKPTEAKLKGSYKWALGPNEENNVLNFCHQKQPDTVCYERMK